MASYTTDSGGTAVVSDAGGLVGTNFGKIIDCYSEANVTGMVILLAVWSDILPATVL